MLFNIIDQTCLLLKSDYKGNIMEYVLKKANQDGMCLFLLSMMAALPYTVVSPP